MADRRRVVPFIRDLNPKTDDLPELLRLIKAAEGDRDALIAAVHADWTARAARTGFSLHSIEANTIASLGPENLGIVGPDGLLSDFGKQLLAAADDLPLLREVLGSEILREHGGWQFGKALSVLRLRGVRPTRAAIATYLQEKYGIAGEWADLNNISSLHSFLEWCGVVENYRLVDTEFERLLSVTVEELQLLEGYTLETRACLEALVRLGGDATAAQIRAGVDAQLHRPIDANQFTSRMTPLIAAGLVRAETRRGDRGGRYALEDAQKAEAIAAVTADLAMSGVVPDDVFEHDFRWVVDRLNDSSLTRDERGHTLEVLAGMIFTRLGLRNIHLRTTSEFEVDVTADYVGAGYQTWSAQCKAFTTGKVRSEHLLREFGIAVLDRYSVLLFVTTSDFTEDAVLTAERIVRQTNVQVIRINGTDLERIAAAGDEELYKLIRSRSENARLVRLGARPIEVFQELDHARDWLLSEKPSVAEVWAHLQRRDLLVDRSDTAMLLSAWLETQPTEEVDDDYLEVVRSET